MTELIRCENVGCKHNSLYKKPYKEGEEPKCLLKEVELVFTYGRSTDYVHELICETQEGFDYR